MAAEVRHFTLSIPAGTPPTAPVVLDVSFPPRIVNALQVIVPPGPSGLVGWAVLAGGVRVIPYQSDLWVVTAGEAISWPLENQPDSGSWQVAGYNSGTVPHLVFFRFLLSQIGTRFTPPPVMIDDQALSFLAGAGADTPGG